MIQDERLFDRTDKQNAEGCQQAFDCFNGLLLRGPVKVNEEVAAEDEIVAGQLGPEIIAEQVAPIKADATANGSSQDKSLPGRLEIAVTKSEVLTSKGIIAIKA